MSNDKTETHVKQHSRKLMRGSKKKIFDKVVSAQCVFAQLSVLHIAFDRLLRSSLYSMSRIKMELQGLSVSWNQKLIDRDV